MASNVNHVPKKQWNKWTAGQRAIFNRVFSAIRYKDVVCPLEAASIKAGAWKVIRWNVAFLAACEAYDLNFVPKKLWNLGEGRDRPVGTMPKGSVLGGD